MATHYKLRCNLNLNQPQIIINYISSISNYYAYVLEKLDTHPHLHFYIKTNTSNPAMRKQLRLLCGSGNGGYSLKTVSPDPVEYLAYMHKEGTFTHVNLPPELITESVAYNAKVAAEIALKKQAKKSKLTTLLELCEGIDYTQFDHSILQVTDIIMDYHRENNLIYRKFQIEAYIQTILIRYSTSYNMYYKCKLMQSLKD